MTVFERLIRFLLPAEAPVLDFPFVASDVALYQKSAFGTEPAQLDAQTWDEMLLPQYSARLAHETSIFGQQELHRRLVSRPGAADCADDGAPADGSDHATARVRALAADATRRTRLHETCRGLRRVDREVAQTLFGPASAPAPRWAAMLPWLPVVFLAAVVLALATGSLPLWGAAVALWLALMGLQVRWHEAVEDWRRIPESLQQLLRTHCLLAQLDDALAAPLREEAALAGRLNRAIAPRAMFAALPGAREYSDWLWLANIRHYFRSRDLVRGHAEFLRRSYQLVAALEADVALARHLAHTGRYCWAKQGARVALTQAVHPLLATPAPLSFALQERGAFISGQNGIGKSTLLRTVGLNLIVARAFGFCYADEASAPMLPVYSSMQGEDALEGGESLYIAELRRARELLALAESAPAFFIIDEIFRGTNHLESISAAAAVLHTLSASGTVIVSSHNLVLAPLLEDRLAPWCVASVDGRLRLAPGVLRETNGIALLAARGFDGAISAKAGRVFAWLSDHMAHPGDCAAVRASL